MQKATETDIINISLGGDLVVNVQGKEGSASYDFRVSSQQLGKASPYFASLLDPDKFKEGADIRESHRRLLQTYKSFSDVPSDELPRIRLKDLGRISQVSSVRPIASDFLSVLHNIDIFTKQPPVANIGNLTIVADRFDALTYFTDYVRRRDLLRATNAKSKLYNSYKEERIRQMLLIGIMLDYKLWATPLSKRLIMNGSSQWQFQAKDRYLLPLWWNIPYGIEDELICRRDYILETINSIQRFFLERYTSRERQCKLGYDSSAQCDSFQLGEMIKFFTRIQTIRFQGLIYDDHEVVPYSEDIERLLDALQQCPAYQVTSFHAHCGLRARLMPILMFIKSFLSLDSSNLEVGICADCWQNHRADYAWSSARRPVSWAFSDRFGHEPSHSLDSKKKNKCLAKHIAVRDIFTANERFWEGV